MPGLGCIDANFCRLLETRSKALDEIYKMYTRLHLLTPFFVSIQKVAHFLGFGSKIHQC